jgi:hypothetical protein
VRASRELIGLPGRVKGSHSEPVPPPLTRPPCPVRTTGGRVLGVTALGDDLADARARAYQAAGLVRFDGVHYRRDIGAVFP